MTPYSTPRYHTPGAVGEGPRASSLASVPNWPAPTVPRDVIRWPWGGRESPGLGKEKGPRLPKKEN